MIPATVLENMAVFSTVHIHPKTAKWMEDSTEEAFALRDSEAIRYLVPVTGYYTLGMPDDLRNILEQAFSQNILWVMFDPDGVEVTDNPKLPKYDAEWEKGDEV